MQILHTHIFYFINSALLHMLNIFTWLRENKFNEKDEAVAQCTIFTMIYLDEFWIVATEYFTLH